jgi:hypothetical protein
MTKVLSSLDFNSVSRILNLPAPLNAGDAVNKAYVDSAVEGLSWKASVKVASQTNVTIATPTSTIDGITLVSGDRILIKANTNATENGIYLFDNGSSPLVRSSDANTFRELEQAVVTVEEGTNAGTSFRQTAVNGVLGTDDVIWANFGTSAPVATETTAGIAEIATQAEVNTGTNDTAFITPLKLANWSGRIRKFAQLIGDGSATSITVNHNLNTRDVQVTTYSNSGNFDEVLVETHHTTTNSITLIFDNDNVPTVNQFRVVVMG